MNIIKFCAKSRKNYVYLYYIIHFYFTPKWAAMVVIVKLWVQIPPVSRCTRYNIMWSSLTDQWFSPGTSFSSTNKTDRHDIVEILLKVALNTIIQPSHPLKNPTTDDFLKKYIGWFVIGIYGSVRQFISYKHIVTSICNGIESPDSYKELTQETPWPGEDDWKHGIVAKANNNCVRLVVVVTNQTM